MERERKRWRERGREGERTRGRGREEEEEMERKRGRGRDGEEERERKRWRGREGEEEMERKGCTVLAVGNASIVEVKVAANGVILAIRLWDQERKRR